MTPHITAKKGEIAKIVLMPGDPLRAKLIAEEFLTDVKLVNSVRNMFMYTGLYDGKPISVCASGMGQPSIGIYSYELFHFYDVKKIIRIGSAGSYLKEIPLYSVVLATSAYTDSNNYGINILSSSQKIFFPSLTLNQEIRHHAEKLNIYLYEGKIHTSDVFYSNIPLLQRIAQSEAICVEMEAASLFAMAKKFKRHAACILTISDNLITKEETTAEQRQNSFKTMMKLALQLAKD